MSGLGARENHEQSLEVNLTPMIDILTCLLFFLLLGYKSQSIMLESAKNLQLPPSSSDKGLVVTMTLSISHTEVKLNDSHVMYLKNGVVDPRETDGNKIAPLYNRLIRVKDFLAKKDPEQSVVLLLADRRLKAEIVTKVMKTCGMAGFPNFRFGVARP